MKFIKISLILLILFSGCSRNIPTLNERKATALSLVKNKNLKEEIYYTNNFNLFSFQTNLEQCTNVNVYIEGDGLSWITRSRISSNPTPLNPIALKLMQVDNSKCKIYLARPCQYVDSKICEKKYWTSHRFNIKVIESYLETLNKIKDTNNNKTFTLIGFSGGGAIATILAAKRNDTSKLVTVAGNLDIKKWTETHNISPLNGSLNPNNFTNKLKNIKQFHLIGKNDKIMPINIFLSYKSNFIRKDNINYKVYDATHTKNWKKNYKEFLKEKNIK